ncbi:MAG: SsrA-binding protein SmpB [Bacillota bacterium]
MEKIKMITDNRRARHEYHILETWEAGLSLTGTEVKSLRLGRVNLKDGFVEVRQGEAFLVGIHISPYEQGNRFNHNPDRDRRLLLHKREILKMYQNVREKGLTLVPLKLYWKNGRAKVEVALARGKKLHDKREALAARDEMRRAERAIKERYD